MMAEMDQFQSASISATEWICSEQGSGHRSQTYTMRLSTYRNFFDALPLARPVNMLVNFDGTDIKRCVVAIRSQVNYGGRKHSGIIHVTDNAYPEVVGRNFLKPLGIKITCGPGIAMVGVMKTSDPLADFLGLLCKELVITTR